MATQNLGRVGLLLKGDYSSSIAYQKLDVVSYNGSSYVCLQNATGIVPTNTTYWQLIAEKGDKGDTGNTGATGATGATGNGISSITKTGTAGLVDTYTITYTDTTTTTFTVTNGEDGEVTEEELQDIYEQMSSELEDSTLTGISIDTSNSAYWRTKINLKGNITQSTNIITYTCDGNESGDYYFVYNETNYQFTMPNVSSGDVIEFNTDTLVLSLDGITIITITASTGTLITMNETPNVDYPQNIQVVTGNNNIKIQNKNLFNYANLSASSGNVTFSYNSNDIIVNYTNKYQGVSNLIPITNKKYTVSIENIDKVNNYGQLEIRKMKDNNVIGSAIVITDVPNSIVIDNSNNEYDTLRVSLGNGNLSGNNTITFSKIYIEEGSIATSYIKHQEQNYSISLGTIELCKIGEYEDKIIKKSDGWYLYKQIDKKIFNGTENWVLYGDLYQASISWNVKNISLDTSTGYCNMFKPNYIAVNNGNIGFRLYSQNTLRCREQNMRSIEDFKTFLSTTNMIIYGVLEQATEIKIIDTTLVNQLNDLYNKAKTYKGITYITQTNYNIPFILTLDYKKSNLLRIQALENS